MVSTTTEGANHLNGLLRGSPAERAGLLARVLRIEIPSHQVKVCLNES